MTSIEKQVHLPAINFSFPAIKLLIISDTILKPTFSNLMISRFDLNKNSTETFHPKQSLYAVWLIPENGINPNALNL